MSWACNDRGGFPASNPKELELFELLARETLHDAEIVAFGMTRRRDVAAEQDEGLAVLASCFAGVCTLVGKSSAAAREKVLKVSREENLRMIAESVRSSSARASACCSTPSTSSMAIALDSAYALRRVRAAAEAGAERVVLCDTNGGSLPGRCAGGRSLRSRAAAPRARHPHPRRHRLRGREHARRRRAGATQVQGTVNGIGERTGNANLITIIADLQLKMGYEVLAPERLRG